MPGWLRRVLWGSAFAALAYKAVTGLQRLDEPEPEEQPAVWPPLAFEKPGG